MSLSNLPPGVSGNEPQIAGYDELDWECKECGTEGVAFGADDFYEFECLDCGAFESIEGYWAEQYAEQQFEAERERRLGI